MATSNFISTQEVNYRTSQTQFLDENGDAISLTGATGYLVQVSPLTGVSHRTAIVLGKWDSPSTQATDAANGWCYATSTIIDEPGEWREQFQLTLSGSEPLYGIVVAFTVNENLNYP